MPVLERDEIACGMYFLETASISPGCCLTVLQLASLPIIHEPKCCRAVSKGCYSCCRGLSGAATGLTRNFLCANRCITHHISVQIAFMPAPNARKCTKITFVLMAQACMITGVSNKCTFIRPYFAPYLQLSSRIVGGSATGLRGLCSGL